MPIRDLLRKADSFSEPMVLVSGDGTIDTSNQPFADQLGVSAEALAGRRLDGLAAASVATLSIDSPVTNSIRFPRKSRVFGDGKRFSRVPRGRGICRQRDSNPRPPDYKSRQYSTRLNSPLNNSST
jgi:hypothetical protein